MNQQNNILMRQIFMQVALGLGVLGISIICEVLSMHMLFIGLILAIFLIANGVRLYRVWVKGDYVQLVGTCVEVDFNKILKKSNVSFRLENGTFLKMTLKGGQSLPIENEQYVFCVKNKKPMDSITHSDILAWSICEQAQK